MSLKGNAGTQSLININNFQSDYGIKTLDGFRLCFLFVQPYNLAVLGVDIIKTKIAELQNVMESMSSVDFICIDGNQSYDDNVMYLTGRLKEEQSSKIKDLIKLDISHLDDISINMATSRDFLFIFRFRNEDEKSIKMKMEQNEHLIRENGFGIRPATENDLKKIFAIYFSGNIYDKHFSDFDGEEFADNFSAELRGENKW